MCDKENKALIRELRAFRKESKKSPEKSRDLLIRAGILTRKGALTKPYK